MRFACFDVESAGNSNLYALQPFRALNKDAWLTSIAFCTTNELNEFSVWSELKPKASTIRNFLKQCIREKLTITGWSTAFDVAWLIALGHGDLVAKLKFVDAMLMWRQLRCPPTFVITKDFPGFGLKAAVREFIPGAAGYEKNITFNPTTPEEWAELQTYNERDTIYTLQLTLHFWSQLSVEQKRVCLVEAACIPLVAETLVQGVKGNLARASALAQKLRDDANFAFVNLRLAAPDVTPEKLASPKQLGKMLTEDWCIPVAKYTEKGAVSTDRESLAYMANFDKRASFVNDYREATANCNKFADGMVESLAYNEDGMVRPAHRIYGTYTGRMTISASQGRGKEERPTGVPLHQWKRDKDFRALIEPPDGYDLLEFDFAGQEFRWMAVLSGDPTMISLCAPGQDAHSYMAAQIERVDYSLFMEKIRLDDSIYKPKRQLGKVANLSLQYRTSANKLRRVAAIQHKIVMTDDDSRLIHRTYQSTYVRVPLYWKAQKNLVRRQNFIANLAGRKVHLPQPHERNPEHQWSYDSTAINYPIQSMGAEQKYLALMVLRPMLPAWGAKFYFELHDGLFVICPKRHTSEAVPAIREALSTLPYQRAFKIELPVDFPVDAKAGPSWGELTPCH